MLSMTGYGSCTVERDGRELHMELKSVNHRYLDISFRIPRYMGYIEDEIRKGLNEKLIRGHVDVFILYRNNREDSKRVKIDMPLLKAYIGAYDDIRRETRLEDNLSLTTVAALPNILQVMEDEDGQNEKEELKTLVLEAFDLALNSLNEMRGREGENLCSDLNERLKTLESLIGDIKVRAPSVVREYRDKLSARITELLQIQVDDARLASEAAVFADRCAIDEEIVRLSSHIGQMRETMSGENNGRKLDFIVQEMNREVNTIASKASDAALIHLAVEAKSEIEKIREQVQNVV